MPESAAPKYALIERERRWLVDPALRPDLAGIVPVSVEDRYIAGTRLRLRVMSDSAAGTCIFKLTKKYESDDPLARAIVTAYLDEHEYAVFAALPAHRIVKQRYRLPHADGVANVDVFADGLAGLELTEIEWPDDAELRSLPPPPWAGREVSHDERYMGGTLATNGYRET